MAGNFAVWGGLFSCFDCTFAAVRKKEDPWNAICAGACTGGLLAARGVCVVWLWCVDDSTTHGPTNHLLNTAGPKAIARNALVGGILLALIEGVGIMIQKFSAEQMQGNATAPQSFSLSSGCLTDDVVPCPLPLCPSCPSYPSAAQQMAAGAAPQDMLAPPTAPPSYSSSSSGPSAESAGFAEGACVGGSAPFFLVAILTDLFVCPQVAWTLMP